MIAQGLARQLALIMEVPRDLLLRRYPPFVTGGELPAGDVPVFAFHSLEPESFRLQLEHLARNGYATLSIEEYLGHLTGVRAAPRKAVLLTFDDARGSLWSVGAPLLRRYGMRGVVFVVPSRVNNREGPPWPTIDDVSSCSSVEEILHREEGQGAFLFWEEIESLARDRVFEFGSHTLSHSLIHCGREREGFVTPDLRTGYRSFDLPQQRDGDRDLLGEAIPLGAPILRSAPRFSAHIRVYENPEVRRVCTEEVASQGPLFFTRPGWQRTLRRISSPFPPLVGTETSADRRAALERELTGAQRALGERIGLRVTHLCYPWHAWSPLARDLVQQTGHSAAFCGKIKGVPIARPGHDPLAIPRIGEDWLVTLPGEGRVSAPAVLSLKWARRLRGRA